MQPTEAAIPMWRALAVGALWILAGALLLGAALSGWWLRTVFIKVVAAE